MSTALQVCNDALRKINVIEPGAAADGAELQGAIRALNLMVAGWASDGVHISIYGAVAPWMPGAYYDTGAKVSNGSGVYTCTRPGTSDTSGGPSGNGTGIGDGTAVWAFYGTQGPIDPSLERSLIALLAVELCPDYGVEPSPSLQKQASNAWAALLAYYISAPTPTDIDPALKALPSQRRFGVIPNA